MSTESVRGAAPSRGGATDTTMLIWKVIAASPGITRAQIWERVEHDIPAGYAQRRSARFIGRDAPLPINLTAARRDLLSKILYDLKRYGHITSDKSGRGQRYAAVKAPWYFGDPSAVDETGTRAAEHMAIAEALRVIEKALARGKPAPSARGAAGLRLRGELYDAVEILARALRAART